MWRKFSFALFSILMPTMEWLILSNHPLNVHKLSNACLSRVFQHKCTIKLPLQSDLNGSLLTWFIKLRPQDELASNHVTNVLISCGGRFPSPMMKNFQEQFLPTLLQINRADLQKPIRRALFLVGSRKNRFSTLGGADSERGRVVLPLNWNRCCCGLARRAGPSD